jgi:hypothetical protein
MKIHAILIYLIQYDLCIQRNIRPLKWSISFTFKQIIVNQINMGNMKISHFCHISLQYADKCHFYLFKECIQRNIRHLKWSISIIFKQIIVMIHLTC